MYIYTHLNRFKDNICEMTPKAETKFPPQLSAYLFIYSLIYLLMHLFTHLSIYFHLITYLIIHLFIVYLFVCTGVNV